jgi:hypothetical protein
MYGPIRCSSLKLRHKENLKMVKISVYDEM